MTWDTIQQFIRTALQLAGGYLLGDAIATGAEYQAFIAGAINVAAFIWWLYWNNVVRTDA